MAFPMITASRFFVRLDFLRFERCYGEGVLRQRHRPRDRVRADNFGRYARTPTRKVTPRATFRCCFHAEAGVIDGHSNSFCFIVRRPKIMG